MKGLQFLLAFALWFVVAFALGWKSKETWDATVHDPRIIRAIDNPALAIPEPLAE